jgi:hypothetical protein
MTADNVTPIAGRGPRSPRPERVIECALEARDGELWRVRVVNNRPESSRRVCNFVPNVVERVETYDASGAVTVSFILDIATSDRVERVEVTETKLLAFLVSVPGLVSDEGRDKAELRRAIAESAVDKPTTRRYAHLGWVLQPDGHNVFLHAGGAIGADGPVDDLRAHVSGSLGRYFLPTPPDDEHLAVTVRNAIDTFLSAADASVTVPLLAAAARAPLGGPPNYWIHLVGATGAGKTSLAQLTTSFFGADLAADDSPTHSWTSTSNALELSLANACDVPVGVDEFTGAGQQQAVAERIGRATTGALRDRARADLSVREGQRPGGLLISTGETDFDRASLQARALVVSCSRPKPATTTAFRSAQYAGRNGSLACVGAAYIKHVAAERNHHGAGNDDVEYSWKRHTSTIRAQLDDAIGRDESLHPRQPMIVTDLLCSLAFLFDWTVRIGAYTETEARQHLRDSFRILCAHIAVTAVDEATNAIEMLRDALAAHRCHLTSRSGGAPNERQHLLGWAVVSGTYMDSRACGPCVGYLHDDTVDLIPDAVVAIVREVEQRVGVSPTMTKTRLGRLLNERGWIDRTERGYGSRRRICGRQMQLWSLPLVVLFPSDADCGGRDSA